MTVRVARDTGRRGHLILPLLLVIGLLVLPPSRIARADEFVDAEFVGSSVATGDVNGDGFGDMVVGVPGENLGGVFDAGMVNVFYGSASGLSATGSQVWHQDIPGVPGAGEDWDVFGSSVAIGDLNGDGFDDVAVGVPGENLGAIADAGLVNVFYGSASGLSATNSQVWHQDVPGVPGAGESGDMLGASIAVGDLDADGFSDMVVGIPGEDVGDLVDAGMVSVFYGSAAGLSPSRTEVWHQDIPGAAGVAEVRDKFGSSVTVGDVNGDGVCDVVVGVPGENLDEGAVNVFFGSANGLSATGSQVWHQDVPGVPGRGEAGDAFGAAAAIGDVNGDGVGDVVVGVPGEGLDVGAVNVFFGSASGLSPTGSQMWHQDVPGVPGAGEAGDAFGTSIAVGDVNGDGVEDVVVGVPWENLGAIADAGLVNVLYGSATGLSATGSQVWHQSLPGVPGAGEAGDAFGTSIAVGDVNGDGVEDVVVGVPGEDLGPLLDAGMEHVLYGSATGLSAAGSQVWHQDSPGVPGVAEPGDRFG